MNQEQIVAAPAPWKAGVFAAVAVLTLIILSVVLYVWHSRSVHDQQVAAARKAAGTREDSLLDKLAKLDALNDQYNNAGNNFDQHSNAATKASNKRHGAGVAQTLGNEDGLAFANQELVGVKQLSGDTDRMYAALNDEVDLFASQYGDSAVRPFRSDVEKFYTSQEMSNDKWRSAARDIADSFQERINGGWGVIGSDVESFYQESEDQDTQASAALRGAFRERDSLKKRLEGDAARAHSDLTSIR